eukprot:9353075-Pyramimonas_sp.AAC.1
MFPSCPTTRKARARVSCMRGPDRRRDAMCRRPDHASFTFQRRHLGPSGEWSHGDTTQQHHKQK